MKEQGAATKPTVMTRNQFGTFGGVFTPAILTILGVIMFMRAGFVVGQAGVIGAILILLVAKSITALTSLSIAAVSTNMQVRGGGSYFLISRVLGVEFGGAIGIALFLALALSVPFYILGFAEAVVLSWPGFAPYFQYITLMSAAVLFGVAYFGAGIALRTQFLIMAFLFLAIVAFLGGALHIFDQELFRQNLSSGYTTNPNDTHFGFWAVFAIYFPAVTGIDAGLNMSGDLKDPGKSIPRGTMAAVGVGFLVYLAQIVVVGGAFSRESLIAAPYELLRDNAMFGWGILVVLGVFAATLSSALGSYLGAPRVLQAVSRDRILGVLKVFSKGSAKGDEPRRALFLTLAITVSVLVWAGNETGGAALNGVAAIITMFFLYSYGMINLAAFTEDFSDNPSFRPQFKWFHWSSALIGAIGCLAVAVLVNTVAAAIAVVLVAALLIYLRSKQMRARFGDVRRGFVYQSVRNRLLKLRSMAENPKNWRPNILVFSGSPSERTELVRFAVWLEARRGIVYLAHILAGDPVAMADRRRAAVAHLNRFCSDEEIDAFPVVAVAEKLEEGISMLLQATAVGPIHPNVAMFGWSSKMERRRDYLQELRTAAGLGMSLVIVETARSFVPEEKKNKIIDIWWGESRNSNLALLFAFLLTENWQWRGSMVRILRVVENEEGKYPASAALMELAQKARVPAMVEIIVSRDPLPRLWRQHSCDADVVLMGFPLPSTEGEAEWHATVRSWVEALPALILIHADEHVRPLA